MHGNKGTLITLCLGRMEAVEIDLLRKVVFMCPPKNTALCQQRTYCQGRKFAQGQLSTKGVAIIANKPDARAVMSEFGIKIKWLRHSTRMDQIPFGDAINVHRETIRKWEKGEVLPQSNNLKELARHLDMPLDELTSFLLANGKLKTIPKQIRDWFEIPNISNQTTLGELSEIAGGK